MFTSMELRLRELLTAVPGVSAENAVSALVFMGIPSTLKVHDDSLILKWIHPGGGQYLGMGQFSTAERVVPLDGIPWEERDAFIKITRKFSGVEELSTEEENLLLRRANRHFGNELTAKVVVGYIKIHPELKNASLDKVWQEAYLGIKIV